MLEKDGEDHLDRSCEKKIEVLDTSQEVKECPTYSTNEQG
jgi:hypothetical protein